VIITSPSRRQQDPLAQQREAGAAIHLAFDWFRSPVHAHKIRRGGAFAALLGDIAVPDVTRRWPVAQWSLQVPLSAGGQSL
jgi:hypothetical protein